MQKGSVIIKGEMQSDRQTVRNSMSVTKRTVKIDAVSTFWTVGNWSSAFGFSEDGSPFLSLQILAYENTNNFHS